MAAEMGLQVSLRTLGRLIQYTGYVVEPYREHPALMDTLLKFLRTEQSATMHRETIRVLGIIGALDPYLQKVSLAAHLHTESPVPVRPMPVL